MTMTDRGDRGRQTEVTEVGPALQLPVNHGFQLFYACLAIFSHTWPVGHISYSCAHWDMASASPLAQPQPYLILDHTWPHLATFGLFYTSLLNRFRLFRAPGAL